MDRHTAPRPALPCASVDKWVVLRELVAARAELGVSDRSLGVLDVLLTFYPRKEIGGERADTVVFPSNAAICDRLNGMPCSTMRRHLSGLVSAGLIIRRDSPNGKRFRRKYRGDTDVYGFDLSPLVLRFDEILAAAERARSKADSLDRLRRTVSLMRRDASSLAEFGSGIDSDLSIWNQLSDCAILTARALRRKLDLDTLQTLADNIRALLDEARNTIDTIDTADDLSTIASCNEHHHQNSEEDLTESEGAKKQDVSRTVVLTEETHAPPQGLEQAMDGRAGAEDPSNDNSKLPNIPLRMVLVACPEFRAFYPDPVRHWHDLVHRAEMLAPMMGISRSAWDQAVFAMGPEEAAVSVLCILERTTEIKSPGGYLRRLSQEAASDAFSCGRMVRALLRRADSSQL